MTRKSRATGVVQQVSAPVTNVVNFPPSAIEAVSVDELLATVQRNVEAAHEDWLKFWEIARPLIDDWRKRFMGKVSQHAETLSGNTEDTTKALGAFYKVAGSLGQDAQDQARRMLWYLWRLAFEFPKARSLHSTIFEDFGLGGLKKTLPEGDPKTSLLKKLNALQHRPLCVATSILQGECGTTSDEEIGAFMSYIAKSGYTVPDGKSPDQHFMFRFVAEHWAELKNQPKKKMVIVWEKYHGQPAGVARVVQANNLENRHQVLADKILSGRKTMAELEASSSIKAEHKDAIRSEVLSEAERRFGVAVLKPSSALYPIAKLAPVTSVTDDGKPTVSFPANNAKPDQIKNALESAKMLVIMLEDYLSKAIANQSDAEINKRIDDLTPEQEAALLKKLQDKLAPKTEVAVVA